MIDWVHTGSFVPKTYTANTPTVAMTYGAGTAYPTGAYGEPVQAPNDVSLSPDAVGRHGAYFVDDGAINETLSQTIYLAAGTYRVGFDAYAPRNGYANPFDATFVAQITGVTLADYAVSTMSAAMWTSYSGLATILNAGYYSASFVFNTPGRGLAKDVIVDRVYVLASDEIGGRTIPEPGTTTLFGAAFLALLAARWKSGPRGVLSRR